MSLHFLRPVRCEGDLLSALGAPLIAARPLAPPAVESLCRLLLGIWFRGGRALLAVVGPQGAEGRTRATAELARSFAAMGERTLLIDADLRSPAQHRLFGLPNRAGLADFLDGEPVAPVHSTRNLWLMVAGAARTDPLALLSRDRLPVMLREAARGFRVVIVDTPAAARGPDLEIFAALAGGALVVARPERTGARALERLRRTLERCSARVVATILNRF